MRAYSGRVHPVQTNKHLCMSNEFNFTDILRIIQKRYKALLLVAGVVTLAAWIGSSPLFIRPKYKSTAVVYPMNMSAYSEESKTEQLIQVLESNALRDTLAQKFDLMRRYGINPASPEAMFYLQLEMASRISIKRTSFEAVSIAVLDESPDTAKLMVDDILRQVNRIVTNMQYAYSGDILKLQERRLHFQQNMIDSLEKAAQTLRERYGILDYDAQVSALTEAYGRSVAAGRSGAAVEDIKKQLNNLRLHGGQYRILSERVKFETGKMAELSSAYEKAYSDARRDLKHTVMVVHPEVPVKKSWPVRWIIVVTSVLAAMLLALIGYAYLEGLKK